MPYQKKLIMDVLRENLTHDPMLPAQAGASLNDHKQLLLSQNSVWRHTDNLEMTDHVLWIASA